MRGSLGAILMYPLSPLRHGMTCLLAVVAVVLCLLWVTKLETGSFV